jgi:hypothetical protein
MTPRPGHFCIYLDNRLLGSITEFGHCVVLDEDNEPIAAFATRHEAVGAVLFKNERHT